MNVTDLQPFCGTEPTRPYLHKPWSAGDCTYATNGWIAMRVPRLPDVPEMADAPSKGPPNVDAVIPKPDAPRWRRITTALPAEEARLCDECAGFGTEHDCPTCKCPCDECDGTGKISGDWLKSLSIAGAPINLRYARRLLTLPGLEVAEATIGAGKPMLFRFEGGDGALMLMSIAHDDHLDIDLLATEPA